MFKNRNNEKYTRNLIMFVVCYVNKVNVTGSNPKIEKNMLDQGFKQFLFFLHFLEHSKS